MTHQPDSRIRAALHFLFSHQGRFGRLNYWLGLIAAFAAGGFIAGITEGAMASANAGNVWRAVALAFWIGVPLWIYSSATIKRLHDRDSSGWWYPLYLLASPGVLVLAIYLHTRGQLQPASILYVLSPLGFAWVFVVLGLMRGTRGPNRFGPDPS